tara:strand:+ start:11 stop:136 length:126 start_codon:yes stop_codon:yes gene_type:complete
MDEKRRYERMATDIWTIEISMGKDSLEKQLREAAERSRSHP